MKRVLFLMAAAIAAVAITYVVKRYYLEPRGDRVEAAALSEIVVRPDSSIVALGSYRAFEPTRLDQLPDSIVQRIDSLLISHVGAEYHGRLRFERGQVVDHSDPVARNLVANMHWRVFGFRLGFTLPAPAQGVPAYTGYLTLDASGHPIAPIPFPPIRTRPTRAHIVDLRVARDSAAAYGVHAVGAELQYSAEDSTLQYVLHARYRDRGMHGVNLYAVIDAHTGRFIRKGQSYWIE